MVDQRIWNNLDEFAKQHKKLESENKFDEAIQVVDKEILYILTRLEAGVNFADNAILSSVSRDLVLVKKSLLTNKKLFELEQRVDNISSQVGRLTKELEGKSEFK